MRVAWLTDLHLSFVPRAERMAFYGSVRAEEPDAILLGGDTGEAPNLLEFLDEIDRNLQLPIYFVLGNHDFYGGSIARVRDLVTRKTAGSRLHWLPATGIVHLGDETALIGHDSWTDGRLGDFFRSNVRLNDYRHIEELTNLPKLTCYSTLNALGDEAADYLEARAREALAAKRDVVVLTHVPPFREACWHEGQISNADHLPHFSCKAVGDRLLAVMRGYPERSMTVLCGHTHSSGTAKLLDNLTVYTGGAEYGAPRHQAILTF